MEIKREIQSPVAVKQEMRSPVAAGRADTDDSMDDTSLIIDSFKQEPENSYGENSHFKEESSMDEDAYQDQSSMLSVTKQESDGEDSDAPLVSCLYEIVWMILAPFVCF